MDDNIEKCQFSRSSELSSPFTPSIFDNHHLTFSNSSLLSVERWWKIDEKEKKKIRLLFSWSILFDLMVYGFSLFKIQYFSSSNALSFVSARNVFIITSTLWRGAERGKKSLLVGFSFLCLDVHRLMNIWLCSPLPPLTRLLTRTLLDDGDGRDKVDLFSLRSERASCHARNY